MNRARGLYYDRAGNEVNFEQMCTLFDPDLRRVALDRIGDIEVSTVHLVINHQWDENLPPLIFETMTFNADGEMDCWRYSTEADALAGHEAVCAELRANLEHTP